MYLNTLVPGDNLYCNRVSPKALPLIPCINTTVEPLYSGHPWDRLIKGGAIYVAGSVHGVLIKGGVLISGVSL